VSKGDVDRIHELNDAVARKDLREFTDGMQPDAVWEHNPGTGSPEEGTYQGRDQIIGLFERILEGWEYMRPQATQIQEAEPGVYRIRGELHCKHTATTNEIVEQYDQTLEIRDGLMVRGRMVMGTTAGG
jgi:ketosteroid isomerase-like protein